jgi:error-prone DNA polymerase
MGSGILTAPGPYCELHSHSCYSLLDGVPFPAELAERAVHLGLPALALTDHDAVYGLAPFYLRARELGLKPILGAELTLEDDSHLTLLAETNQGYAGLCQLITAGRADAPKGGARLAWSALAERTGGLLCLTGCRQGLVARRAAAGDMAGARRGLSRLLELFGGRNVYVELQRNFRRDDARISRRLAGLARERGLPCVATGNVHYLSPEDAELQSALVSIRERTPLARAGPWLRPNHEYFLRSADGMALLYPDLPEAIANTRMVAERCNASLPMGLQVLPQVPTPRGLSAEDYLRFLCELQLRPLYPGNLGQARALLDKELGIIHELGLANYFLVVWDIVAFCERRGILCHGRGSAANSIVARLLGISAVDPIAQALVIERFISVEHGGTPDIDLDIDAAQRESVIQYVYDRWGRDHAAMACTYITFRSASAIRDAGFALGFKAETLEEISAALAREKRLHELDSDGRVEHADAPLEQLASPLAKHLTSHEWRQLVTLAARLKGRPRHLGLHNGGMVVTGGPIAASVPIEPAAMEQRTVVQFDKEWLEALGIVKIDLLGLRMLSAISDAVKLVQQARGKSIDLNRLDFQDSKVFDQICSGQTIGMFQVESGAQESVIPYMQPRCLADLVIEVSLIRPGPLQGNMVRPYLRRRNGQEPVTYMHPLLQPALAETLGVIVFQEQVIKVARDFAGFTPGRGELLRRALGHKDAAGELAKFHDAFVNGAIAQGAPPDVAEKVWQKIAGFAGYSFCKSHAASFAVIVYWSAWLRTYYPAEFFCGLLRNAPLGTYPPHVLEAEARRAGVKFLPFDINRSLAKAAVENGAIRFGLGYVHGIGDAQAGALIETRGHRPFRSMVEFIQRTGLKRHAIEWLIMAGAFDSFGERRQVLWDLAEALDLAQRPPSLALEVPDEQAELAPMTEAQRLLATFAAAGVTAGPHLTFSRRDAFIKAGCQSLHQVRRLRIGARVKIGGLIADGVRRPPTARGTAFIRLEQAEGLFDVILPEKVYLANYDALRGAFVIIEGILQKNHYVPAIVARRVFPLGE